MKALVTGGAGFIGSHVVDKLIENNIETKVLVSGFRSKNHPSIVNPKATIIKGNLLDVDSLLIATKDVDMVFHLGGMFSHYCEKYPELTIDVNIKGTWNLKKACVINGVKRIIYASSSFVYGQPTYRDYLKNQLEQCKEKLNRAVGDIGRIKTGQSPLYYTNWTMVPSEDMFHLSNEDKTFPVNEIDPTNPKDLLGITKISSEKILQSTYPYKINYTILRLFNVYGPRQYPEDLYTSVVSTWIKRALDRKSLVIHDDGTQSLDFNYVKDVADAFVLAMNEHAENRIFNVGSGTSTTMNELAQLVNEITGNEAPSFFNPSHPMFLKHVQADIGKIKSTLGWSPKVDMREGLRKTAEFFKESLK